MSLESGHTLGTRPREVRAAATESGGPPVHTTGSRLLSVEAAAQYLSVSSWSIRDYVASGRLPAVQLPAPRGTGTIRRVLIDRNDLDAFIERSKCEANR